MSDNVYQGMWCDFGSHQWPLLEGKKCLTILEMSTVLWEHGAIAGNESYDLFNLLSEALSPINWMRFFPPHSSSSTAVMRKMLGFWHKMETEG